MKAASKLITGQIFKGVEKSAAKEVAEGVEKKAVANQLSKAELAQLEKKAVAVTGAEVEAAGLAKKPATDIVHKQEVEKIYAQNSGGRFMRRAAGAATLVGASAGATATLYPVIKGTNFAVNTANAVENSLSNLGDEMKSLVPPTGNIHEAINSAERSAHSITAGVGRSAKTGVTILVVLGGMVVAYEIYRFTR